MIWGEDDADEDDDDEGNDDCIFGISSQTSVGIAEDEEACSDGNGWGWDTAGDLQTE